jgi:glycosyltransferase involved in cell wall biosynthesis
LREERVPLVSICCITFNQVNFIKQAIDSFLMQKITFPLEIIINDDASTDGTTEILKTYEKNYPDLIFPIYHAENEYSKGIRGIMIRNTFPKARGKYIALCEGDDYWTDPLKLQKQVDFLEKNNQYSMVCHDAVVINEIANSSDLFFTTVHKKQICSTKDVFGVHFCPTASIVFRKEAIVLTGFYPKAMAGDLMLTLLLSLKGLLYRMNEVMSVYRKLPNGMTEANRATREKSLSNRMELLKHFNVVSNYKYKKYIRIEVLIIKSSITYLKTKSKYKIIALKIYRKMLLAQRKRLFKD